MSQSDLNRPARDTGASAEPPVLLAAINLSLRALEDRIRLYRNLVVAVCLLSISSVLAPLLFWRALPLAKLILVVALPGVFIFLDCRRVAR